MYWNHSINVSCAEFNLFLLLLFSRPYTFWCLYLYCGEYQAHGRFKILIVRVKITVKHFVSIYIFCISEANKPPRNGFDNISVIIIISNNNVQPLNMVLHSIESSIGFLLISFFFPINSIGFFHNALVIFVCPMPMCDDNIGSFQLNLYWISVAFIRYSV